jgi:hypothetical protein
MIVLLKKEERLESRASSLKSARDLKRGSLEWPVHRHPLFVCLAIGSLRYFKSEPKSHNHFRYTAISWSRAPLCAPSKVSYSRYF